MTKNIGNAVIVRDLHEIGFKGKASILLEEKIRQRCEVWTRCMGYHRPVSHFNVGKKGEFYERKYFKEPKEVADGRCDGMAK